MQYFARRKVKSERREDLEEPLVRGDESSSSSRRAIVGISLSSVTVPPRLKMLNLWALRIIIVAAIGGLGVASFQSIQDDCGGTKGIKDAHFCFAFMFFAGGLAYAVLMWRLDVGIPSLGTSSQRFWRRSLAFLALFQFFTLIVVLPLLTFTLHELPNSPGVEMMSAFEISLLGSFMFNFLTFLPDFKQVSFSLIVWHHKDRKYSITERAMSESESGTFGYEYEPDQVDHILSSSSCAGKCDVPVE